MYQKYRPMPSDPDMIWLAERQGRFEMNSPLSLEQILIGRAARAIARSCMQEYTIPENLSRLVYVYKGESCFTAIARNTIFRIAKRRS